GLREGIGEAVLGRLDVAVLRSEDGKQPTVRGAGEFLRQRRCILGHAGSDPGRMKAVTMTEGTVSSRARPRAVDEADARRTDLYRAPLRRRALLGPRKRGVEVRDVEHEDACKRFLRISEWTVLHLELALFHRYAGGGGYGLQHLGGEEHAGVVERLGVGMERSHALLDLVLGKGGDGGLRVVDEKSVTHGRIS